MKTTIFLGIGILILALLTVYSINKSRILEDELYQCEQEWSRDYEELKIQIKILEFHNSSLEYQCSQGKG